MDGLCVEVECCGFGWVVVVDVDDGDICYVEFVECLLIWCWFFVDVVDVVLFNFVVVDVGVV